MNKMSLLWPFAVIVGGCLLQGCTAETDSEKTESFYAILSAGETVFLDDDTNPLHAIELPGTKSAIPKQALSGANFSCKLRSLGK